MTNPPHLRAQILPPLGLSSWMIFDESWTCWSREPRSRVTRPEQHLCSVWQASYVIYDLVTRDNTVVSLIKVTAQNEMWLWPLLTWKDKALDTGSSVVDRYVSCIHGRYFRCQKYIQVWFRPYKKMTPDLIRVKFRIQKWLILGEENSNDNDKGASLMYNQHITSFLPPVYCSFGSWGRASGCPGHLLMLAKTMQIKISSRHTLLKRTRFHSSAS